MTATNYIYLYQHCACKRSLRIDTKLSLRTFRVERDGGERANLPGISLISLSLENTGLFIFLAILTSAAPQSICRLGKIIAGIFSASGNKVYLCPGETAGKYDVVNHAAGRHPCHRVDLPISIRARQNCSEESTGIPTTNTPPPPPSPLSLSLSLSPHLVSFHTLTLSFLFFSYCKRRNFRRDFFS